MIRFFLNREFQMVPNHIKLPSIAVQETDQKTQRITMKQRAPKMWLSLMECRPALVMPAALQV